MLQATPKDKIVIAHRGASGYLPEHTLTAYAMAYGMGAHYLEPDLVMTADGHMICRHDITLEQTTNISEVFPERHRDDGHWYAADFSLAEIRACAARERLPGRFRRDSLGYHVPTFEELLQMVAELNRLTGGNVGVYPETKAPAFHRSEHLALEEPLVRMLADHGYEGPDAPVWIQSFDPDSLRRIRSGLRSRLPLAQLIDMPRPGKGIHADMPTPAGLDEIAGYAQAIAPDKRLVDGGGTAVQRALVEEAHARGLAVHPYTFRADQVQAPYATVEEELAHYWFEHGVDGVFLDHPDRGVRLLAAAGADQPRSR